MLTRGFLFANHGWIRLEDGRDVMVFLSKIVEPFLFLGDFGAFSFMLLRFFEGTKQSTTAPTEERDSLYRHDMMED